MSYSVSNRRATGSDGLHQEAAFQNCRIITCDSGRTGKWQQATIRYLRTYVETTESRNLSHGSPSALIFPKRSIAITGLFLDRWIAKCSCLLPSINTVELARSLSLTSKKTLLPCQV
ncbi:hypothetical protein Pelo_9694 [Pelomyxa schiedti]|nr:hypothetical protein Pelo_9694 [Pelomyxa schiedti]